MLEYPRIYEHIEVIESLHHEHFSVEELADILGVSPSVINAAVRRGDLKGFVSDHRIVDIRRSDALEWLQERAKS
jgi:hypothetical protein